MVYCKANDEPSRADPRYGLPHDLKCISECDSGFVCRRCEEVLDQWRHRECEVGVQRERREKHLRKILVELIPQNSTTDGNTQYP